MPSIADMDFSKNSPEVNVALVKLQAMHNLGKLPEIIYAEFIPQLKGTDVQKKNAIEKIEDLEDGWFNPFYEEYGNEIINLSKIKLEKDIPEYFLRGVRRKIRLTNYNINHPPYKPFVIKNNKKFTASMAREILNMSQQSGNNVIHVVIASTKELNKDVINLLTSTENVRFLRLGRDALIGKDDSILPSSLIKCIEKMENIEKGINPKWSNTAKALYIFRKMYHSCEYSQGLGISSVLLGNKGICQGFAHAYQEMMVRQNIPCHVCMGEGNHVFNEIKLNNEWYPVDLSDASGAPSTWVEKKVEQYTFAGKNFIYEQEKHHHRSPNAKFMIDKEKNIINYLTEEEYESAVAEIENRQGTNEKELLNDEAQQEKYKRAKGQKESINQDNSSLDAILCKRFENLHKR